MRVLVNVPDLNLPGGVANYYKTLSLNSIKYIDYFNINGSSKSFIQRLVLKYIEFYKVIDGYDIVHINPSLQNRSVPRDGIFILLSKLLGTKILVFFHGWDDEFEKLIQVKFSFIFRYIFGLADRFILLGSVFQKKLSLSHQLAYFLLQYYYNYLLNFSFSLFLFHLCMIDIHLLLNKNLMQDFQYCF